MKVGWYYYYLCFLLIVGRLLLDLPAPSSATTRSCNGSMAECYQEEYEILMESEISRRFLEQKKYISPGALKRDEPVCNEGQSGEAYSKNGGCLPPQSNAHNRGCFKYYSCRPGS